ncbi:N-acetylmuramoyl-L-alanine amidase [Alicyclobacillus kakegawensis]|uniref:N-acetylmuramoyl-L-alanine amidase n=1 Tax=Alicyclobacillus kakegawensis TaxID=392012 RepID=UPI001FDF037A|nr:N-acetylmuramoyl-L-alanine amidase [Alicyclobacillus kakegawensis]
MRATRRWRLSCAAAACSFTLLAAFSHPVAAASDPEPNLVGRVIVLDAGHGGPDGGARAANGVWEKTITLAIAKRTAAWLEQAGARVYLTRTEDTDLATDEDRAARRRHQGDLRERVRFIRRHHPDVCLVIHCDAVPSSKWSGATTLYHRGNEDGERLAAVMQDTFREALLPTKRDPKANDTLYILRRVPGATALAEVGFLSHPYEASQLQTPAYQERVALALYLSVVRYLGGEGSPPETPDD